MCIRDRDEVAGDIIRHHNRRIVILKRHQGNRARSTRGKVSLRDLKRSIAVAEQHVKGAGGGSTITRSILPS